MQLQFLGANRQVTGSRYLLRGGGLTLMIDCGLFQERPYAARNWEAPPLAPNQIDCLLLTHAHLDHCGLIPKLVHDGFHNRIICTAPTIDLAKLVLLDSAKIQEEDAAYKRRRHERERRRGPFPVLPLYTAEDAERALTLFQPIEIGKLLKLNEHVAVRYFEAGHILGSAMIEVTINEAGKETRVLFSGDIGLWNKPLIHDPTFCDAAEYVVMESTYGDREHVVHENIEDQLAEIVNATAQRGGHVVIPTFAIDRAQEIIYHFSNLIHFQRLGPISIFLDSPMAVDATGIFKRYSHLLDADVDSMFKSGRNPFHFQGMKFVQSVAESRAINSVHTPCVIMAGAGMCTGGRIKHHLSQNISRPESTILFVGYQAAGTLGREILDGATHVRIHNRTHQVKARIARLDGLSAHADRKTLLHWLSKFRTPPKQVFLTHGEEQVALGLAETIRSRMNWNVDVPHYQQTFELM